MSTNGTLGCLSIEMNELWYISSAACFHIVWYFTSKIYVHMYEYSITFLLNDLMEQEWNVVSNLKDVDSAFDVFF